MPTLYDVAHFCSWNGYSEDMNNYLGVDRASITNQEFHFPFGANVTYGPKKKSRIQRICEEMRPTYNDNNYYAYAIARGYSALKRIEQLLSYGAKPDIGDTGNWTPLLECARNGWETHKEIAEVLINAGADVNHMSKDSWTPLYLASYNNHLHIVKLLVSKGANVNLETRHGSVLDAACYKGHLEVVKYLVSKGSVITKNSYKEATRGQQIAIIKYLATLSPVSRDALVYAVEHDKHLVIPILAKVGADVNFIKDGKTLVEYLAWTEDKCCMTPLLKAGANPNLTGQPNADPPIFHAINSGLLDSVKALCDYKANINILHDMHEHNHLVTPIHYAIRMAYLFPEDKQHIDVVKILIKKADLKLADSWGDTPIQFAEDNLKDVVTLMKRELLARKKR